LFTYKKNGKEKGKLFKITLNALSKTMLLVFEANIYQGGEVRKLLALLENLFMRLFVGGPTALNRVGYV